MIKRNIFIITLLLSMPALSDWFSHSNALTFAHQNLLEGNTGKSFSSLIQAWQQNNDRNNLVQLFSLMMTNDCGRDLTKSPLPSWLQQLVIRRERVQAPNRVDYFFSISGRTEQRLSSLLFSTWPDSKLSLNKNKDNDDKKFSYFYQGLTHSVDDGLFQLEIKAQKNQLWSSWLFFSPNETKQIISWRDKGEWQISSRLNYKTSCPQPMLRIQLFEKQKNEKKLIWSLEKEHDLPTSLPTINVKSGQYWLMVSIVDHRWQGPILFEDVQSIARMIELPINK